MSTVQENPEPMNQSTTQLAADEVFAVPLSFGQERLWLLDRLEPDTSAYNVLMPLRLEGRVDVRVLEHTFTEIVRRHDVLRATFSQREGTPLQIIAAPKPIRITITDVSYLPIELREDEARKLAKEHNKIPFDLRQGPIMRVSLLKLGEEDHVLLVNVHHIVFDGWSISVFLGEFSAIYEAYALGKPSPLPELTIRYTDFALWQRRYLTGQRLEQKLSYWRKELAGAPASLDLPTDRPRPSVQTFRGAKLSLAIGRPLVDALKKFSQKEGSTLFMTLLTAFKVLLWRYSGQEDLVVGSPIAGRNRAEIEKLIGFFVNTLVLRTDVSGNPTFRQLLARVRETTLAAFSHQDLPFEKLVEELKPERDLSRNPVFQVMFILQNTPKEHRRISALNMSTLSGVESTTAKFDLMLLNTENADGIRSTFEYNTDLFDGTTIERMQQHWKSLLEAIVADASRPIADMPLLSAAEQNHLLVELNSTAIDYPRDSSVPQLIEQQAERTPNRVAVQFADQTLSYAQLNSRANQLAHYLQSCGVRPDDLVGIFLDRSLDMVVAVLGIMKAGGAYVPLDPAYPEERIAFIVEDAKAPILLTQNGLLKALPKTAAQIVRLDEDWATISRFSTEKVSSGASPDNLAYVIYTSGSTGKPKGVQIQQRSVVNFLHSMRRQFDLTDTDTLLAVTTLSFDIAGLELYLPLITGTHLVVASREETQDGRQLIKKIEKNAVTVMQATPATWRLMLESGWNGSEHLKVLCGGEALPRELIDQLLPRCKELWNMYGPTETTIWSTIHRVTGQESTLVPIGKPIANTETYVLDAYRQPTPMGVVGELYIGGDGLARGYLNRDELTKEKFVPHPFQGSNEKRLYRTGDLARYRPDGSLLFLGRIDNQVKLRGFRIELGEIETVLTEHAAVQQSVVLVREDQPGNQQLVAYLVLNRTRTNAVDIADPMASDQVNQWGSTWDETYKQISAASEATFNITGWNSSYTGQPVPREEMEEWVKHTVERIRALAPERILEIGCGTGLLLFRLADSCRQYEAMDLSQTALDSIRKQLEREPEKYAGVCLNRRSADDLTGFTHGTFDTVVLNSVVQYFPNTEYLVKVLQQAVELVSDGGAIFIGDVRNLGMLEAFHSAVQLYQASEHLSAGELLDRIRRKIDEEQELLIDPKFFHGLQGHLPRITDVEIRLKAGRYQNEVTRFRYDVVLHINGATQHESEYPRLDWDKENLNFEALRGLLESAGDLLGIKGVPNARNWDAVSTWRKLNEINAQNTVGDFRKAVQQSRPAVVEPDDLIQFGKAMGFAAVVDWSRNSSEPVFDIVFRRFGSALAWPRAESVPPKFESLDSYANNPLRQAMARRAIPELKSWLKNRLPDYMVPSVFMVLDRFPLTSNGKINRKALPAPGAPRLERESSYVAPSSETERELARIWSEILRVDHIGANHDFFNLGGHSLLATQVVSRIQKRFNRELPLRIMFEHPTVSALAKIIENTAETPSDTKRQVIAPVGRGAFRLKRSSL